MKIRIENLSFYYPSLSTPTLSNINLEIKDNEFIGLIGPTGSGKTTLVQHLNGLLRPSRGRILIDDQDLWDKRTNLSEVRRRIGLVFQFPEVQFFESTVFDEVAFGPRNLNLPDSEIEARVERSLQQMDLDPQSFKHRSPFRLSEGEKRRLAIASVLAMDPEMLILDEPTAGMDHACITKLEKLIRKIFLSGKTIILISHDMDLIARSVNRVVVLNEGKIYFDGRKEEILTDEERLKAIGLNAPEITLLVKKLRNKGVNIKPDVFTIEEVKECLKLIQDV